LQFLRATPLIDGHIDREGIERAFDDAETNNGWLIFYGHDVTDRRAPMLLTSPAQSRPGGIRPPKIRFDHGGGDAMRPRLKRFVCHFGE